MALLAVNYVLCALGSKKGRCKQEFGIGIMGLESPLGKPGIVDRIAIDASVRTGIVFANVARRVTATLLAASAQRSSNETPGDVGQSAGIDAARVVGAFHEVIPLRAN